MRRNVKTMPVHLCHSVESGEAHLVMPTGLTLDDLDEIEQAVRLQIGVVRRELERVLAADWDEALKWDAALREAA